MLSSESASRSSAPLRGRAPAARRTSLAGRPSTQACQRGVDPPQPSGVVDAARRSQQLEPLVDRRGVKPRCRPAPPRGARAARRERRPAARARGGRARWRRRSDRPSRAHALPDRAIRRAGRAWRRARPRRRAERGAPGWTCAASARPSSLRRSAATARVGGGSAAHGAGRPTALSGAPRTLARSAAARRVATVAASPAGSVCSRCSPTVSGSARSRASSLRPRACHSARSPGARLAVERGRHQRVGQREPVVAVHEPAAPARRRARAAWSRSRPASSAAWRSSAPRPRTAKARASRRRRRAAARAGARRCGRPARGRTR